MRVAAPDGRPGAAIRPRPPTHLVPAAGRPVRPAAAIPQTHPRTGTRRPVMTIVVGYIPRPEGLAAVDAAIVEAERRGERLVVVNTGHHGDNTDPSYAAPQDLDALDAQLTARGVEHEIRQPTRGRAPADELLDAADEVKATLLVIGLRRRSPLGKLITGSTAQQVLLDAT